MSWNLLERPLIPLRLESGETVATLPDVLAHLTHDAVISFPALMPHQAHAWHAFLVQVAGLALERARMPEPPPTAPAWAEALRALTPGFDDDAPWCLIGSDWSRPAFLQSPVPKGCETDFRGEIVTPDQLDILVTAKNHDVKSARLGAAQPVHWLYALLTLQTMEGFLGAGNYGIARMNGGFSSRPALGLVPGPKPGARFRRDLAVLRSGRRRTLKSVDFFQPVGGLALLWLEPWDGTDSLPLSALDPWFIEICRRVRLAETPAGVAAVKAGSKVARIAAAEQKGNVGDPWVPVDDEGKALSLTADGFSYERLQPILTGAGWTKPLMLEPHRGIDGDPLFVLARGLARGQGQTAGYHERLVPVPARAVWMMAGDEGAERLGPIAAGRVKHAHDMERRVLWPALMKAHDDAAWASRWRDLLDTAVDAVFFDRLWEEALAPDPEAAEAARRDWLLFLRGKARDCLNRALESHPRLSSCAYRVRAAAESLFDHLLYKQFPELKPSPETEIRDAAE